MGFRRRRPGMGCARRSRRYRGASDGALLLLMARPPATRLGASLRGAAGAHARLHPRHTARSMGRGRELRDRTGGRSCRDVSLAGSEGGGGTMTKPTFGFPRMHKEAGERRDFLPPLIASLAAVGVPVVVEAGIGSGMGLRDSDYTRTSPLVSVGTENDAYRCDVVVVLRAPVGRMDRLRPGATLVSMLHLGTRPARATYVRSLGVEAIGLDQIQDDMGRRLVVDSEAVAWNGLEAAFDVFERTWPSFARRDRPIRVLILGAGEIGRHAVEASTKYGSLVRDERMRRLGCEGVLVTTVGRNVTALPERVEQLLGSADILVDATQRHDPSVPVIRNAQLARLPEHAVICDLAAYAFETEDPAWEDVPPVIPTSIRRRVVSCYSWPGVHPLECMELYGKQMAPLLTALAERGGAAGLRSEGSFEERALIRGRMPRLEAAPAAVAS